MAYLTLFCRKQSWFGQIPNFYRKFVSGAPLIIEEEENVKSRPLRQPMFTLGGPCVSPPAQHQQSPTELEAVGSKPLE